MLKAVMSGMDEEAAAANEELMVVSDDLGSPLSADRFR